MTSSDDDRWSAWCSDFDEVAQEMMTLFHTRWMWRTITGLLNHSVPEQHEIVQNYLIRTYVGTVCTAIRREADRDARTTSLARCLQALIDRPQFASRARYVALLNIADPETLREHGDVGFNRFAGPGDAFIDPVWVAQSLDRLRKAAAPVKKYTDKVLAHRERVAGSTDAVSVSWGDINAALDELGSVTKMYYSLRHPGVELGLLTPNTGLSFLAMFEVPWWTADFVPPDEFDLG